MLNDRRLVDDEQEFTGQTVVQKLFDDVAPKFAGRNGGYTRIIKLSDHRIGDGGSLCLLQLLLEENAPPKGTARRSAGLRRKRNERRHQFAAQLGKKKDKGEKGEKADKNEKAEESKGEAAAEKTE
jgi:large subunit ribosomal protein L17